MKKVYVGIGALIEKDEKYLIVKRSPMKDFSANSWEIITGRLEIDEQPEQGVLREVKEETNFDVEITLPLNTGFFYRGENFPMVFIIYWCKYVRGELLLNWEHSEYKWLTLVEAIDNPELHVFTSSFKIIQELKKYLPKDFSISKFK